MIENGHEQAPIMDLTSCESTNTLIRMCDPKTKIDQEAEFSVLWQTVRDAMESITIVPLV